MKSSHQLKDQDLRHLISLERKALGEKRKEFQDKGKIFKANEYSGIVPQKVYDALRDRSDKKFRLPKSAGKTINRSTLRKIADGDRKYPVKYFVIHHSVGPDFVDGNHIQIAQWYSDVGKSRAYANVAHSGHYFNGKETFASNHLVGHWHGGVWCIFPIIDDYWNCVSWGAGNWAVNQQAINIENCGRFSSPAPDAILRSLADWWRPQHRALGGNSLVVPHREVSQTGTACPERLGDQLPTVRSYLGQEPVPPAPTYKFVPEVGKARVVTGDGDDLFFLDAPRLTANIKGQVPDGTIMDYVGYVEDGDDVDGTRKWWRNAYNSYFTERYAKKVEAPAPPPPAPEPPKPDPAPAPAIKYEPLEISVQYVAKGVAKLWNFNFDKHSQMQEVSSGTKKAGDKVDIVGKAIHPTGSVYLMTPYSYNNSGKSAVPYKTTGYNETDMDVVRPTPPPDPIPAPDPNPAPPAPEKSLWQQLLDLFEKIKKALGG